MSRNRHSGRILDILTRSGRVDVTGLVSQLAASPATVRRELARLERQGLLKRDRGGAQLAVPAMFEPFLSEVTFGSQVKQMAAEKSRIGALAASFVKDGETIGISPGTTATQVARFLQQKSNLMIVTNAVNVAMELSRKRDFKIHLTGGQMSGDWFALVGARALDAIPEIKMDYFFFGAGGIDAEHGITDQHVEEAAVNRAMAKHARKRVLVADHLKLGRVAKCLVCAARDIEILITDTAAREESIEPLRALGLDVRLT